MKVKIHKWANVVKHCKDNAIMRKAFNDFYNQLQFCDWEIPSDILKSFRTADIVSCEGKPFNRVVFNVGGNKFRLIYGYKFGKTRVVLYVRFVETHSEYDEVVVCEVDMF